MSESKLFPYKMKKQTWFRAEDGINDSDIAVIVDTRPGSDTIWFWEGAKSSARSRSNAREILGQLKKKYIPYKFKRVTKNSPEEILLKLEELKGKSYTGKIRGIKYELKDFSRAFFSLNIIGGFIALFCIIYLAQIMTWNTTTKELSYTYYSIDYNMFLLIVNITSLCLLFLVFVFAGSAFFGGITKNKIFSVVTIIAAILSFIAFFMLRIWDQIIFYETVDQDLLIRKDILVIFAFCLEMLIGQVMVLSFLTGFLGIKNKNVSLFEKEREKKIEPEKQPETKKKT